MASEIWSLKNSPPACTLLMALLSSFHEIFLGKYPFAPDFNALKINSSLVYIDTMMTFMLGCFSLSRAVSSMPDLPGNDTSIITICGSTFSNNASSSLPSAASPTTNTPGVSLSKACMPSRTKRWSSTRIIFMVSISGIRYFYDNFGPGAGHCFKLKLSINQQGPFFHV